MINLDFLDELAQKLEQILPPSFHEARQDIKENFKLVLETYFKKMNLVTAEEFHRQVKILEEMQKKILQLEEKLNQKKFLN